MLLSLVVVVVVEVVVVVVVVVVAVCYYYYAADGAARPTQWFIWGFGYKFTNYDFRKTLDFLKLNRFRRDEIKSCCCNPMFVLKRTP